MNKPETTTWKVQTNTLLMRENLLLIGHLSFRYCQAAPLTEIEVFYVASADNVNPGQSVFENTVQFGN
jgi:hypothetical protein